MCFRDFMERALYEPGMGYYARSHTPWSEAADFVTAPQVDASFGAAVARLARECDAALGVLEFGGGDGSLMADICEALARDAGALYERLRIYCIERGAAARAQQRERLAGHGARVTWIDSIDEAGAGGLQGLVLSNELLDAFPVHRVVWRADGLREMFVDVESDALVEREHDPSTPALRDYLDSGGIELEEGQIAEICLAVGPWVEGVARCLDRGFVLTVDYGSETEALYGSGRLGGALVCQHRYQLNANPYQRVGEQDITAHVDLGNLRRCGETRGLDPVGTTSLAVFLLGFGAADGLGATGEADESGAAALRRRLGLRHLLFTEIGDAHRVFLQTKGVPPIPFGVDRLG